MGLLMFADPCAEGGVEHCLIGLALSSQVIVGDTDSRECAG
jgi:hypothetical protein